MALKIMSTAYVKKLFRTCLAQTAGISVIRVPFHTLDIYAFLGNALMSFLLEKQL